MTVISGYPVPSMTSQGLPVVLVNLVSETESDHSSQGEGTDTDIFTGASTDEGSNTDYETLDEEVQDAAAAEAPNGPIQAANSAISIDNSVPRNLEQSVHGVVQSANQVVPRSGINTENSNISEAGNHVILLHRPPNSAVPVQITPKEELHISPPPAKRKYEQLSHSPASDDEGQICSICFEPWTNASEHRLISLKCGHLFGSSCILKWLKGQGSKCPQCNAPAKKQDIRYIFAKCLKVLDTAERDRALRELEKERELRRRAELATVQIRMKYELVSQECEKLKKDLSEQKNLMQKFRKSQGEVRSVSQVATSRSSSYVLEKTIDICKDGGCRVMDASDLHGMIAVSHPSFNNLFPGYGFKKVSTVDFRPSEFVCIHQKGIKDLAFHPHDAVLLTASLDRTIKLTNVNSNSVMQTYLLTSDVWSCAWSKDDACSFYAGLKCGSVLQFDTRMTNSHVCQLANAGSSSPVVSLQYVERKLGMEISGPLVGQLAMCCFYEVTGNQEYRLHPLPMEGNFTCVCYEPDTGHVLLSCRPSQRHPRVTHMLCEMALNHGAAEAETRDYICSWNVMQVLEGGSKQIQLSKSRLFVNPENPNSVMVCAGDESAQAALLWDASTGQCVHRFKADSPVLDVYPLRTEQGMCCLTTLTEKSLRVYRWNGSET